MDKPKDTDVVIMKEVFHVKYIQPQYTDLTDDNETDITHISETQIPPKHDITIITFDEEDSESDTLSIRSNTTAESDKILLPEYKVTLNNQQTYKHLYKV